MDVPGIYGCKSYKYLTAMHHKEIHSPEPYLTLRSPLGQSCVNTAYRGTALVQCFVHNFGVIQSDYCMMNFYHCWTFTAVGKMEGWDNTWSGATQGWTFRKRNPCIGRGKPMMLSYHPSPCCCGRHKVPATTQQCRSTASLTVLRAHSP